MSVLQWPDRCTPNTRRAFLQAQAAYMAAEAIYRAAILNDRAELCDIHIVEQRKYHEAAEKAIQAVSR